MKAPRIPAIRMLSDAQLDALQSFIDKHELEIELGKQKTLSFLYTLYKKEETKREKREKYSKKLLKDAENLILSMQALPSPRPSEPPPAYTEAPKKKGFFRRKALETEGLASNSMEQRIRKKLKELLEADRENAEKLVQQLLQRKDGEKLAEYIEKISEGLKKTFLSSTLPTLLNRIDTIEWRLRKASRLEFLLKNAEAAEEYNKVSSIFKEIGDDWASGVNRSKEAENYVKAGKMDKASIIYYFAARIFEEAGFHEEAAKAYISEAKIREQSGNYSDASYSYIYAIQELQEISPEKALELCLGMAEKFLAYGDLPSAAAFYFIAEKILRNTERERASAFLDEAVRLLLETAEACRESGDLSMAASHYESIHKKIKDIEPEEAAAFLDEAVKLFREAGAGYQKSGDLKSAAECFKKAGCKKEAKALFVSEGEKREKAKEYGLAADAYLAAEDLLHGTFSEETQREESILSEKAGDMRALEGDRGAAIRSYESALGHSGERRGGITKKLRPLLVEAAEKEKGSYSAIGKYKSAANLYEEAGELETAFKLMMKEVELLKEYGKKDKMAEAYSSALKMGQLIPDTQREEAFRLILEVAKEKEDHALYLAAAEAIAPIDVERARPLYLKSAELRLSSDSYSREEYAMQAYDALLALKPSNPGEIVRLKASIHVRIAEDRLKGEKTQYEVREASEEYAKAAGILKEGGLPSDAAGVYETFAKVNLEMGHLGSARRAYLDAIEADPGKKEELAGNASRPFISSSEKYKGTPEEREFYGALADIFEAAGLMEKVAEHSEKSAQICLSTPEILPAEAVRLYKNAMKAAPEKKEQIRRRAEKSFASAIERSEAGEGVTPSYLYLAAAEFADKNEGVALMEKATKQMILDGKYLRKDSGPEFLEQYQSTISLMQNEGDLERKKAFGKEILDMLVSASESEEGSGDRRKAYSIAYAIATNQVRVYGEAHLERLMGIGRKYAESSILDYAPRDCVNAYNALMAAAPDRKAELFREALDLLISAAEKFEQQQLENGAAGEAYEQAAIMLEELEKMGEPRIKTEKKPETYHVKAAQIFEKRKSYRGAANAYARAAGLIENHDRKKAAAYLEKSGDLHIDDRNLGEALKAFSRSLELGEDSEKTYERVAVLSALLVEAGLPATLKKKFPSLDSLVSKMRETDKARGGATNAAFISEIRQMMSISQLEYALSSFLAVQKEVGIIPARQRTSIKLLSGGLEAWIKGGCKEPEGIPPWFALQALAATKKDSELALIAKICSTKDLRNSKDKRKELMWYLEDNSHNASTMDAFFRTAEVSSSKQVFSNIKLLSIVQLVDPDFKVQESKSQEELVASMRKAVSSFIEKRSPSERVKEEFLDKISVLRSSGFLVGVVTMYGKYNGYPGLDQLLDVALVSVIMDDFHKVKFPTKEGIESMDYLTDAQKGLLLGSIDQLDFLGQLRGKWIENIEVISVPAEAEEDSKLMKQSIAQRISDMKLHFMQHITSQKGDFEKEFSFEPEALERIQEMIRELEDKDEKESLEYRKLKQMARIVLSVQWLGGIDVLKAAEMSSEITSTLSDLSRSTAALFRKTYGVSAEELESLQAKMDVDVLHTMLLEEKEKLKIKKLVAYDSADPVHLILAGKEPDNSGSCQRYDGTPDFMVGLLGYLLNAHTKIVRVENQDGVVLGRAMLRAVLADGKPALLLERHYYRNSHADPDVDRILVEAADKKAKGMGVQLIGAVPGKIKKLHVIVGNGLSSRNEYSDLLGGMAQGGVNRDIECTLSVLSP